MQSGAIRAERERESGGSRKRTTSLDGFVVNWFETCVSE